MSQIKLANIKTNALAKSNSTVGDNQHLCGSDVNRHIFSTMEFFEISFSYLFVSFDLEIHSIHSLCLCCDCGAWSSLAQMLTHTKIDDADKAENPFQRMWITSAIPSTHRNNFKAVNQIIFHLNVKVCLCTVDFLCSFPLAMTFSA